MPTSYSRLLMGIATSGLLVASSCSDSDGDAADVSCLESGTCTLEIRGGNNQEGEVDNTLPDRLEVAVLDQNLLPEPGIEVVWDVANGEGEITSQSGTSDVEGLVSATAKVGVMAGQTVVFRASIPQLSVEVSFEATTFAAAPNTITEVAGNNQSAVVAQPLEVPFQVRIADAYDNPVSDVRVSWSVVGLEGSIDPASSQTDASGLASAVGTVGQQVQAYQFVAEAEVGSATNSVTFEATATPGTPVGVFAVSGDEQRAQPETRLFLPLVVRVVDGFGNPVPGEVVNFGLAQGEGAEVTPTSTVTNGSGQAEASVTLGGEPGEYRVEVTSGELAPIEFRASAIPPICSPSNWCWMNPSPQGNTLMDAFTDNAGITWAVGEAGTILRYDGIVWEPVSSGVNVTLNAIHGAGSNFLIAVGDAGIILRWDGVRWTRGQPSDENLLDVWMASPMDGWAVGDSGHIYRFDGLSWSRQSSATTQNLRAVFGFSSSDVYAAGERSTGLEQGTFLRFDGVQWSRVETTVLDEDVNGIWGVSPDALWLVCDFGKTFRWTGENLLTLPEGDPRDLVAVFGSGPDDVFAVGGLAIPGESGGGTIRRWNGQRWSRVTVTNSAGGTPKFRGITQLDSGQMVAVGEGGALFGPNPQGRWEPLEGQTLRNLGDIWGRSDRSIFAVGERGTILFWDGGTWRTQEAPSSNDLNSVRGLATGSVWAGAADGGVLRFDGTEWTVSRRFGLDNEPDILAIWPLSESDVIAVGEGGTVARFDGNNWADIEVEGVGTLNGVYAANPNDVWVAENGNTVAHFDGTEWTLTELEAETQLQGIIGTGSDNVWTWGTNGTLFRFDGTEWAQQVIPTTANLFALWPIAGTDEAVAVGDGGLILKLDAGFWLVQNSGVSNRLFGAWAASADDLFVAGDLGAILRQKAQAQ